MEKQQKTNLTVILILMIITGLIIYFMYMKPEGFFTSTSPNPTDPNPTDPSSTSSNPTNTSSTSSTSPNPTIPTSTKPTSTRPTTTGYICAPPTPDIPASILSRYFGVGFNIYPVLPDASNAITSQNYYLIEHIPISNTGTAGGMYSISSDGNFTIKIRNNSDPTQWWFFTPYTDTTSTYQIIQPFTNNSPPFALQYANGNISIRPFTAPGFEAQKWVTSTTKVTRGIPVLNSSPASLFTAEFDPYSSTSSVSTNTLSDANSQQVTSVVNAVKAGIQQYLLQAGASQPSGQVSSSSLGNKGTPLNVNLNLSGSSSSDFSGMSPFANVSGSTSDTDVVSILDKYEAANTSSNLPYTMGDQTLYTTNDLQTQLNTYEGCKLLNINDYTSNRVASCNCKL